MTLVRSALFALLFYSGTCLIVLAALAATPLGKRPVRAVSLAWVDYCHWLVTRIVGIRFCVEGEIPSGQVLLAAKHQAMIETLELVRMAGRPMFVVKHELVEIPLFGRVLRRYGVIAVDRSAGARALRAMLGEGRRALEEGRAVV